MLMNWQSKMNHFHIRRVNCLLHLITYSAESKPYICSSATASCCCISLSVIRWLPLGCSGSDAKRAGWKRDGGEWPYAWCQARIEPGSGHRNSTRLFKHAPFLSKLAHPNGWNDGPGAIFQVSLGFPGCLLACTILEKPTPRAPQDHPADVAIWMGLSDKGGGCCKASLCDHVP